MEEDIKPSLKPTSKEVFQPKLASVVASESQVTEKKKKKTQESIPL